MRIRLAFAPSLLLAAALLAPPAPASAATCVYGADGKVLHQPPGEDCRDVVQSAVASEFRAPRPTQDGPWLELRPGDEHIFAVEATSGRSLMGKPFRYTTYKGTQHRSVIPAPERFGAGAMERRITLRVVEGDAKLDQTDLQRDFIRLTGNGYQLLSVNRFWYFARQDVDLGDGVFVLPAKIVRGVKWPAFRVRDDLFKVDEIGEVIDLEKVVTAAGTFENCLHVRYSGDAGSRKTRIDGRSIIQGKYVRDAWFARGVGLVRETEEGRVEALWKGDSLAVTWKWNASIQGVKAPAVPAKQN